MNTITIPQLKPIFPAVRHRDYREVVDEAARTYKNEDAFIIKTRRETKSRPAAYRHVSFQDFREDVYALGTGLIAAGLSGKRTAVLADNCYEWILTMMTVLSGTGIFVPLDKGLPQEEILSSIERAGCQVLIFDKKHRQAASQLAGQLEESGRGGLALVSMDDLPEGLCLPSLMKMGREALDAGDTRFRDTEIDPDAVHLFIFTSGTTSRAKAVMLTETNVLNNVYIMEETQDIRHGDINMAFLPLHHTFASGTQVLMISSGVTTVFCDGLRYIQKNMVEYGVTIFVGVPLLIEAIWKKIMQGIHKQGKEKAFQRGLRLSAFLRRLGIDRRRAIFKDIHAQLGGRLRYVFSGASALDAAVADGFEAIGICVVEGYGMTEASPVICTQDDRHRRPGTVGMALPSVELELRDVNENGIGEIYARSPSIMKGYYEDPEETAACLSEDGWLRTGDLGRMDEDGYLCLTGRSKNVIVLKNGKNVYPEELEALLTPLPGVKENVVLGVVRHEGGDPRDLAILAKVVYDPDIMRDRFGCETEDQVQAHFQAEIDRINEELPAYKQIQRLHVQQKELIKTTTGKVKRFEEGAVQSFRK